MGTYDKFATPEHGEPTPAHTVNQSFCDDICQSGEPPSVSQGRRDSAGPHLTDEAREAAIERAARSIERHMAEVAAINNRDPHVFSDFADAAAARWKAQWARRSMELLIAGRSAEYIAKLEQERGLA